MFIDFKEKGRGWGGREEHRCERETVWGASCTHCNQGSNYNLFVYRTMHQPTEPLCQGLLFLNIYFVDQFWVLSIADWKGQRVLIYTLTSHMHSFTLLHQKSTFVTINEPTQQSLNRYVFCNYFLPACGLSCHSF